MLSDLYLCDFLHNETLRGKKNVYIAWFNFLVEMEMKYSPQVILQQQSRIPTKTYTSTTADFFF